jgi:hypothetical protein
MNFALGVSLELSQPALFRNKRIAKMNCIARAHTHTTRCIEFGQILQIALQSSPTALPSDSALGEFATHVLTSGKLARLGNIQVAKNLCKQKGEFATLPRAPSSAAVAQSRPSGEPDHPTNTYGIGWLNALRSSHTTAAESCKVILLDVGKLTPIPWRATK